MKCISGHTKLVGVLGWPIGHSLSPHLHNQWITINKIDATYVALPVDPIYLATVVRALPRMGFIGVNVTVPHKENIFQLVDEIDELAMKVGAINTIDMLPSGQLRGRNTDVYGFEENLRSNAKQVNFNNISALVLGAGGASRAICIALSRLGISEILLANRTRQRAEVLSSDIDNLIKTPVRVVDWDHRDGVLSDIGLVVNTTSLGMTGQQPLSINLNALPAGSLVADIVYTPLETPLLAQANQLGHLAINGLDMFLYQAQAAFRGWFDICPVIDDRIRTLILNHNGR